LSPKDVNKLTKFSDKSMEEKMKHDKSHSKAKLKWQQLFISIKVQSNLSAMNLNMFNMYSEKALFFYLLSNN